MTIRPRIPNLTSLTTGATMIAAAMLLVGAGPAWSQTAADTPVVRDAGTLSHDCTEVTVDYADAPGLTREERIARMDRAFQRSLSRFEECQTERAATGSGSAAGAGAGSGGGSGDGELKGTETAGTDAGAAEPSGAETSTAASDISGPDAPLEAPALDGPSTAASDVAGDEPTVTASSRPDSKWTRPADVERNDAPADGQASDEPVRETARTQSNGRVPEDIPPADNDSALEAQIRQAAIEETDPELKKRLWDEYRRYKGLPVTQ